MSSESKRRRVGGGGVDGIPPVGGGNEEVKEMKSKMDELINQNRKQTETITSMLQMMQSQSRDINRLTQRLGNSCDRIERKLDQHDTLLQDQKRAQLTTNNMLLTTEERFDGIEDTFNGIEGKLKYHDILLQNQGWKYSALDPSDDYWDIVDEDEQYEAGKFLEQIKKCTEDMRYGSGDGNIDLLAILPYNHVYLPHWQEFANALKQYHYHLKQSPDTVSKLYLNSTELPETLIDLLSNALESTHFKTIDLRDNNFGQYGIDFALGYLKSNLILEIFSLSRNPISSMDINKLCEIVQSHPSIKVLHLIGCMGPDINGYEKLQMIMNAGRNKLEEINLRDNINTGGDTFISDFLVTNPILTTLNLEYNHLNDNDAIDIANAMKQNNKLCFLKLIGNRFTKVGWAALRKAEFDDTSLNAASDCNHSCNIIYPPNDGDEIEGLDISEMNGAAYIPKLVRQKKIYSVLSSRNRELSNVEHFENIHVKLLPNMLNSIQNYSNYHEDDDISQVRGHVQPLSIVYEVCRNWEESIAVFEALSS